MSGTSINVTLFIFVWFVIIYSLAVCSADTHDFQRRFHRSDSKADPPANHADRPPNAPVKPSPDDKKNTKLSSDDKQNNLKITPPSNISVTTKSEDIKPDPHQKQPVEDVQQSILPIEGKELDNLPVGGHNLNQGALLRGFYVFVGLSAIVVIYIVVKTISVRRKKSTVRKYGILTNREDVEMTPLGAEDEEEDTTLFDVSNQTRP